MNRAVFADAGLSVGPSAGAGPLAGVGPSAGVLARARCIGRVSDAELKALYAGPLALAFPSLTEGFGLPPVEAMLCGCPVIATTGGAVPEICGDAARYVDPTDLPGWTAALEQIATDATLRQTLAAKGRIRAARYTWAGAAEAVMMALR